MLFNLYQISSEDAASVFVIKAEMASLFINFDQARVEGRRVEGSNLSSKVGSVTEDTQKCADLSLLNTNKQAPPPDKQSIYI